MRKILFLLVFFSILLMPVAQAKDKNSTGLAVHFLGISEGEASLVQFPNGYTILIDSGSQKSGQEVAQLLLNLQVKRIDTLILTGEMDGHIGGTEILLGNFPIEQIIVPEPLKLVIQTKIHIPSSVAFISAKEGQIFHFPMDVALKILHPGEPLSLSPQGNSLVLQLVHERIKFLFTSDINQQIESKLARKYKLKSQILKVSDSGSNQGSDPEFLKQVDAHAAIIFKDGHPEISEKVIDRLRETWMDVYQTKSYGTISIFSDGKTYKIQKQNQKGFFNDGKGRSKD